MVVTVSGVFSSVAILNYSREDCDISYEVATGPLIQAMRLVHVLLCVAGIVATSSFVFVLFSRPSSNLHINLRLSLCSLSVAALIACAQLLFTAVYGFLVTFMMDDPCNAIIDSKKCAVIRWPIVLSIYSTLAAILSIAVERTIATVRYKTYEVHGSRAVGIGLITAQWSIAFAFSLLVLWMRHAPGFVHYCTVYVTHPKSAVISLSSMLLLELFSIVFFATLLHINKRKQVNEFVNNALHTLTERYQLQENVRMMQILIPSVAVHATLSLLGLLSLLAFALAHRQMSPSSVVQFAPYSEMVLLVVPLYAIIFPLVSVGWNPQMRNATRASLPCLFAPLPEALPNDPPLLMTSRPSKQLERESDRHFGLLAEMWNK